MALDLLVLDELFLRVEPFVAGHHEVVCTVARLKPAEEDVIFLELMRAHLPERATVKAADWAPSHLFDSAVGIGRINGLELAAAWGVLWDVVLVCLHIDFLIVVWGLRVFAKLF